MGAACVSEADGGDSDAEINLTQGVQSDIPAEFQKSGGGPVQIGDKQIPAGEPLQGTVIVTILNGKGLVNVDSSNTDVSDPYVKIYAIGADGKAFLKLQTKTIDNSLDPIWNERFSIYLASPTKEFTVRLCVWDEDPFSPHDSMGQIIFPVNINFPFEEEMTLKLKPRKNEKVSGSLRICLDYRPGQQINLNEVHEKRMEQKRNWKELPNEAKQNIKEWRLRKDVLTECEELKMELLQRIYQSNFNSECAVFRLQEDSQFGLFKFKKATWPINEDDLTVIKWNRRMEDKKGDFVNEAKDIIDEVCKFQAEKLGSYRDGYKNDPEGLFCEEIKVWAADQLSILAITSETAGYIDKRIGYLEECLLVSNLFDVPSSLAKVTIQMVIVRVRKILKYRALANIEKELSHEDASRAFGELKRNLAGLVRCCFKFLAHVFRCETTEMTNADRLLLAVESDENIKKVLGDELKDVKNKIQGLSDSGHDAPWQTVDLRELGLKKTKDIMDPTLKDVKLPYLPIVFREKNSGIEEWFRGNAFIAMSFLRAHGLLLEVGRLFVVIEKAANLAKTGGTLLVYGIGNAHLNATLDATSAIMEELKKEFNNLSKIAECCFEELVFSNQATSDRTEWITQFKHVFPGISEINKGVKECKKVCSDIKHTANSVSLYERFQKAAEEQSEFVNTAESFSKRMCEISGKKYVKPEPKKLTEEDTEAWMKLIKH